MFLPSVFPSVQYPRSGRELLLATTWTGEWESAGRTILSKGTRNRVVSRAGSGVWLEREGHVPVPGKFATRFSFLRRSHNSRLCRGRSSKMRCNGCFSRWCKSYVPLSRRWRKQNVWKRLLPSMMQIHAIFIFTGMTVHYYFS